MSSVPAPVGQSEAVVNAVAIPAVGRRAGASSSPRWLMWLLAVIAVVLIAIGVAAPQVTYALDADRYDEFVDELKHVRSELVDAAVQEQAAELLLAMQVEEIELLIPHVEAAGAADPAVIPANDAQALAAAASQLRESLPEQVPGSAPDAEGEEGVSAELKRLNAAIASGQVKKPLSWLDVDASEMAKLAGLVPEDPRAVDLERTVSLDALDRVRRWVKEDGRELAAIEARLQTTADASAKLVASADEALEAVNQTAAGLPAAANLLLEDLTDVEAESAPLLPAAQEAAHIAASKSFTRFADGTVKPTDGLVGAVPDTATEIQPRPAVRSMLALTQIEAYVGLATTAREAQQLWDEENPETEEDPETPADGTSDTPVPPDSEPPVVPPVVEPPVEEPPVPDPPTEEPEDPITVDPTTPF